MGARPSSFKVTEPETVETPTRQWSKQQQAIFRWFSRQTGRCSGTGFVEIPATSPGPGEGEVCSGCDGCEPRNLVVTARAGTGKTTTILEGVNRAPEDAILLCAFNKKIADELSKRITNGSAEAKTLHALGYSMIRREWPRMPVEARRGERADSLTLAVLKDWQRDHGERVPLQIIRLITNLHTKGREMVPIDPTVDDLVSLAFRFDYVPDDGWGQFDVEFVATYALAAMHEAATVEPTSDIGIDYADMIYLPLAWKLTARDYQLVVVDEAQDMTLAQLEIAQRVCSGRICVVGDDRQAIYGFRGADSRALGRLKAALNAQELPLTVTYRCGHEIVKHANRLVDDIEAHESNAPGFVDECTEEDLLTEARPGDFILSRLNAPLVAITLRLLRKGIRAHMAGRDIGAGILAILKKCRCSSDTPIEDVIERLTTWERKTVTRLAAYGQEDQIARVRDQAGMLYALCEEASSTVDLFRQCEYLFSDNEEEGQVVCSSVHKAKGLEADRVFFLMNTLYRRGHSPEEANIEYVGITRAKKHLTLVQ